jgi:hypothetical protein
MQFDKNLDGWSISEKNLAENEESMEKVLIQFQKDSKEEALIGELRLYAKKVAKHSQEEIPDYESREAKAKKELAEGKFIYEGNTVELNDLGKKVREGLLKIIPLEIEYQKETQKIATDYEAKLAKLLS